MKTAGHLQSARSRLLQRRRPCFRRPGFGRKRIDPPVPIPTIDMSFYGNSVHSRYRCCSILLSNASAGGQSEQPSDVNNSTTTGSRPDSLAAHLSVCRSDDGRAEREKYQACLYRHVTNPCSHGSGGVKASRNSHLRPPEILHSVRFLFPSSQQSVASLRSCLPRPAKLPCPVEVVLPDLF